MSISKQRARLIHLIGRLPESGFLNKDIEGWLADDVVKHYDDHPFHGDV